MGIDPIIIDHGHQAHHTASQTMMQPPSRASIADNEDACLCFAYHSKPKCLPEKLPRIRRSATVSQKFTGPHPKKPPFFFVGRSDRRLCKEVTAFKGTH